MAEGIPVPPNNESAPRLRRFEIRSRLGEGGAGVVYEAIDRATHVRVALKTLRTDDAERIRSLKNEFRTVQDLQHPNIVQLLELFEENGGCYLSMEFVAGTDFVTYVRPSESARRSADRTLPPQARGSTYHEFRLRAALRQLAIGLCALHDAQKVHLDIKPANVLVTPRGRVVIVDFGISRDIVAPSSHEPRAMLGTASYMAPEQVLGGAIGPAADWYAVGVVLFLALTGAMPVPGAGLELLSTKLTFTPPRARSLVPSVPADLDQLCADLLRVEPGERPSGAEVLRRLDVDPALVEPPSRRHRAGFVGRSDELAVLERALGDAVSRGAVTVVVEGPSGLGKSRLVLRFLDQLATTSASWVLLGRCYERESVPYKGVDTVIDELAHVLHAHSCEEVARLRPPDAELLAHAFPVLAAALDVVPHAQPLANPADARARVYTALRVLLGRLARDRAIVVAIDDLQWAGADTLTLLAELMRPPNAPHVLLVATCRTGDATDVRPPPALAIPGDVRRVPLGKLQPAEAHQLATSLLEKRAALTADDLDALVAEAQGHPLFLEELVTARMRGGAGGNVVRLEDALYARVSRLDAPARLLLEAVCVAGAPTPVDVVARATQIATGEVFRLTAGLRSARFVAASAVRAHDLLAPYHDRVREAVVARLTPEATRVWHLRLAEAFEAVPDDADPEILAVHWDAAGDAARAGAYAVRAAERASAVLAFERAAQFYERALALRAPDAPDRDALRAALADALANAGRGADAATIRLELAQHYPPVQALDQRRRAAEELLANGHLERGSEVLAEALAAAGVWAPRSPLAVIVGLLVVRVLLRFRGLAFRERDPAQLDPATLVRIDTVFSAGGGYALTDNVRGAYFIARNLLLALDAGDRQRVTIAVGFEAAFVSTQGAATLARTEVLVAEMHRLAVHGATPRVRALSDVAMAYRDYFIGSWRTAAEHLARAEQLLRDECVGARLELSPTRVLLYRTLGYLGELHQLRTRVPPILREAQRLGDVNSQRNLESGPMMLLALAADDCDGAKALVVEAERKLEARRFHLQHYMCVVGHVQTDLYRGNGLAAVARIRAAWPRLRRSLLLRVQIVRGWAYEHRARVAIAAASLSTGRERAARLRSAEADAAYLEREGLPWCVALARLLRACAADVRGDAGAAIALYREAVTALRDVDLALHAAAAELRLGARLGGDEGAQLQASGESALSTRGVKNPERFAACLAPGPR